MPRPHVAVPELASLLDGSSAGELIPELARYGLQQLIELEASAVIGADRHERWGWPFRVSAAQLLRLGAFCPRVVS